MIHRLAIAGRGPIALAGVAGCAALLATLALPLHARAQSWDATVTAAVPAVETAPLPPLPRRPIPIRQARRGLDKLLPSPALPENLPQPAPKPPIWATASTAVSAPAPARAEALPPSQETETGSLPESGGTGPRSNFVRQFCVNIADAAADARYAWQKKTLTELEDELGKRMELLQAKAAEARDWLARRDEFSRKAREGLVRIYSRMRPDAAAAQLSAMDEETAAAVLNKLDPRNASVIMSEMEPAKAARLTSVISGAARIDPAGNAKAESKEKRS